MEGLRNLCGNPFSAEIRSCGISMLIHINKNSNKGDLLVRGDGKEIKELFPDNGLGSWKCLEGQVIR